MRLAAIGLDPLAVDAIGLAEELGVLQRQVRDGVQHGRSPSLGFPEDRTGGRGCQGRPSASRPCPSLPATKQEERHAPRPDARRRADAGAGALGGRGLPGPAGHHHQPLRHRQPDRCGGPRPGRQLRRLARPAGRRHQPGGRVGCRRPAGPDGQRAGRPYPGLRPHGPPGDPAAPAAQYRPWPGRRGADLQCHREHPRRHGPRRQPLARPAGLRRGGAATLPHLRLARAEIPRRPSASPGCRTPPAGSSCMSPSAPTPPPCWK